jgi:hypothetical protein
MTELKRRPVTFGILIITTLVFMAIQIFRFGDSTSGATIFEFGGLYGLYLQYDPANFGASLRPSLSISAGSISFLTCLLSISLGSWPSRYGALGAFSFSISYPVSWAIFSPSY